MKAILSLLFGTPTLSPASAQLPEPDSSYETDNWYFDADSIGNISIELRKVGEPVWAGFYLSIEAGCGDGEWRRVAVIEDVSLCELSAFSFDEKSNVLEVSFIPEDKGAEKMCGAKRQRTINVRAACAREPN